jgi:hypothetical protein
LGRRVAFTQVAWLQGLFGDFPFDFDDARRKKHFFIYFPSVTCKWECLIGADPPRIRVRNRINSPMRIPCDDVDNFEIR